MSHPSQKPWIPLVGLFLLGIVGGIFIEAGDLLIRLWGRDQGYTPKDLDLLNLVELLYSLKFLWSPLLILSVGWRWWGSRRSWIVISLLVGIGAMGLLTCSPFFGTIFIIGLILITLARSGFDMLAVASQVDATSRAYWGLSENFCMNGYRVGMTVIGSGALILSSFQWPWPTIYGLITLSLILALLLLALLPLFTFLDHAKTPPQPRFWHALSVWIKQPGSWIILILMMTYRLQDGLIEPQMEYFLLDEGLSKLSLSQLKPIALWAGVGGGFLSGLCIRYYGYRFTLLSGLLLHGLSALGLWLHPKAWVGLFYILYQFTKGFSMLSFFSLQLICCQIEYAVTQLSLLTALANFGLKLASLRSGWIASEMGWCFLFGLAFMANIPLFFLTRKALKVPFLRLPQSKASS